MIQSWSHKVLLGTVNIITLRGSASQDSSHMSQKLAYMSGKLAYMPRLAKFLLGSCKFFLWKQREIWVERRKRALVRKDKQNEGVPSYLTVDIPSLQKRAKFVRWETAYKEAHVTSASIISKGSNCWVRIVCCNEMVVAKKQEWKTRAKWTMRLEESGAGYMTGADLFSIVQWSLNRALMEP